MVDTARSQALEIFQQVLRRRQPLDGAIGAAGGFSRLPGPDQAFARRLVTTAIRRLGQIDDALARCLERPLPAKAKTAQDVLRLGAAQLLFMEIPDHAAVDTAVGLFRAHGQGGYAKLINAVLRRLAREGRAILTGQDAPRLNTPDWLWRSWAAAHGDGACRKIAEAHITEPPLDISTKGETDAWAARLGAEVLPGGSLRLRDAGAVTGLPGFADGEWWVQDVAAHLVCGLLGDIAGKRVIDLCAAPGGKTAALAAAGATVTAVDRSANRLRRLRGNLSRLGLSADIVEADAARWRPSEPVDAVLLDAPCSATGTLRRHPDAAYSKSAADIDKLSALQARLLAAAAEMVKPGGTLVFATCSLQPEEGPGVVRRAFEAGVPLGPTPISGSEVFDLDEVLTPDGWFRSLPFHLGSLGGMDGFFACRFART